ncbi:MAG: hypothetical protein JNK84_02485 [Phreatobacter sp.]|uniref:hypothetical protein n=1 Tax=Phreatobacter sp. TaxID=1966341 RepID=UPI001A4A0910|nr:hypothetical protein [Phreatobacter sp.]MBL8567929.1 hypothetical protein [Phreatobacter sp.]
MASSDNESADRWAEAPDDLRLPTKRWSSKTRLLLDGWARAEGLFDSPAVAPVLQRMLDAQAGSHRPALSAIEEAVQRCLTIVFMGSFTELSDMCAKWLSALKSLDADRPDIESVKIDFVTVLSIETEYDFIITESARDSFRRQTRKQLTDIGTAIKKDEELKGEFEKHSLIKPYADPSPDRVRELADAKLDAAAFAEGLILKLLALSPQERAAMIQRVVAAAEAPVSITLTETLPPLSPEERRTPGKVLWRDRAADPELASMSPPQFILKFYQDRMGRFSTTDLTAADPGLAGALYRWLKQPSTEGDGTNRLPKDVYFLLERQPRVRRTGLAESISATKIVNPNDRHERYLERQAVTLSKSRSKRLRFDR